MPEFNDALARLCRSNLVVPSAMFFFFSRNVYKKFTHFNKLLDQNRILLQTERH